jgi:ABC-type cobalt transport system substrate-binding protein
MRWLPILVLVLMIGCVLSIAFMNDRGDWPGAEDKPQGSSVQPSDQPLLSPAPKENP